MTNIVIKLLFCYCLGLLVLGCDKETKEVNCPITYGTLVDPRDGSRYATVSICTQLWMAQNLRYELEGALLNPSNPGTEYGRLYSYDQALKVCPNGWHLPTDEEWRTLEEALGMTKEETEKIGWRGEKEGQFLKSTTEWNQKENSSNSAGFRAVPAGYHKEEYLDMGGQAYFWTASAVDDKNAWGRSLKGEQKKIKRSQENRSVYQSCRCIMD
ncbi:FISUMP domain-containing protein [Aureispira anguillae]|uniref:Fibrobacter succinogenes major paralogous domain-containing protein n=1 Tax=Aureispira anguillae TaxID=2864201 RepID=A0A915YBK5_9BACT|nr:FISUMP domain-containing protein [Aureispira anguillae]BDS10070.1 hypothetical protein AsAng_0007760 [Aureispira anguillae]